MTTVTIAETTHSVTVDETNVTVTAVDSTTTATITEGINAISQASDTLFTSLANDDSLFYNSTSGNWENNTPANARTKLGLVSGGAGDIWVLRAGDDNVAGRITITTDFATESALRLIRSGEGSTQNAFEIHDNGGVRFVVAGNATDVGIGTDTPEANLHIKATDVGISPATGSSLIIEKDALNTGINILVGASNSGWLRIGDSSDADAGVLEYSNSTNSWSFGTAGSTDLVVIDSAGKVGIGTTTPSELLHLFVASGTARARIESGADGFAQFDLRKPSANQVTGFRFQQSTTTHWNFGTPDTDDIVGSGGDELMIARVTSSPEFWLEPSGALGLGNTAPSARLHLTSAGLNTSLLRGTDSGNNLLFDLVELATGDSRLQLYDSGASAVVNISTDATAVSYINVGNFGINQVSPLTKLHITDTGVASAVQPLRIENTSSAALSGVSIGGFFGTTEGGRLEFISPSTGVVDLAIYTFNSSLVEKFRFTGTGYQHVPADITTDTAPNDDTTTKKWSLQKLAAPPTNAMYVALTNSPGTDTFYIVYEEA